MLIVDIHSTEYICCGSENCGGPYTGDVKNASQNGCIGQHCAAWRWWDPTHREIVNPDPNWRAIGATPVHHEVVENRRGYCGLAGRPERDE